MIGDPEIAAEVIDISLEHGEMRIYVDVSYSCFTSNTTVPDYDKTWFVLDVTPFIPSTTRNRFMITRSGSCRVGFLRTKLGMVKTD